METNCEEIFDISNLSFSGDFESQVQELMKYVRLSKDEVEGLQLLIDDLQHALQNTWRGCKVFAFGSIVTGLGIKTSDVDFYVKLPTWQSPSVASVRRAKNILRKMYNIFQNVIAIDAKVPIVKFYHIPTKRNCDVNFSSPSGVQNSELLRFLIQSNHTILLLNIILKYWAKVHKLTGTNLLSSYALTLLVIFYLQQRFILPSVFSLQENVTEHIICDWNMAFDESFHQSNHEESLFQLLSGFFSYYRTFDFEKFIISPYLGQTIERKMFSDISTVPDEYVLYKNNVCSGVAQPLRLDGLMCVQDPFEHNRNCTVAVYPKLANTIIMLFDIGARSDNNGENNYLQNILTRFNITDHGKKNQPGDHPIGQPMLGITKRKKNKKQKKLTESIKNHIKNIL